MILNFGEYIAEKYRFKELETKMPNSVEYRFVNRDGYKFIVNFWISSLFDQESTHDTWTREYKLLNPKDNEGSFSEINTGDVFGIIKTVTDITLDFIKKYDPEEIKIEHIPSRKESDKRYQEYKKSGEMGSLKPTKRALINKRFLERDLPENYSYTLKEITSYIIKKS